MCVKQFKILNLFFKLWHVVAGKVKVSIITLITVHTCMVWKYRQTGFLFFRVGNTGIPGVWLFHTGNRYSFENIVAASIGGLLATPPGRLGFPLVIFF